MKIATLGAISGLTTRSEIVALGALAPGFAAYGDLAWMQRQGRASRRLHQGTRLPSRFKLGSSDVAATSGRKSTQPSRSKPNVSANAPPTSARVEPNGDVKQRRPAKRPKRFGRRTRNFRPDWSLWPRKQKKNRANLPALVDNPSFSETPGNHGYTSGVIALFLGLVQRGVSLRGTSRVLEFVARFFGLPFSAPHWTTGRMWLLRFGFAQLNAPKAQADDWAWLIDHSVQIGKQKVLAIVGIRISDLPAAGECLRPEDLVLIDLTPMETATRRSDRGGVRRWGRGESTGPSDPGCGWRHRGRPAWHRLQRRDRQQDQGEQRRQGLRLGVQHALLKMLEGTVATVSP
jgi:hypothetical protein